MYDGLEGSFEKFYKKKKFNEKKNIRREKKIL